MKNIKKISIICLFCAVFIVAGFAPLESNRNAPEGYLSIQSDSIASRWIIYK